MKWQSGLRQFRESCNLTNLQPNFLDMMHEELDEYDAAIIADDWHEQVDAVCDQLVLTTNCIAQTEPLLVNYNRSFWTTPEPNKSELLGMYSGFDCDSDMDVLLELSERLHTELINLGVIPELAMKQVVKHISSRVIDPSKADDFATGKLDKWPKDPNQDPATIYEPNYTLCRTKQQ